MVPVSTFFSRLMPSIVGCPEPLAQQALVDSAIALCDQALVVQIDLDPVPVLEGVRDYELELPPQQQLSQVIRVWAGDSMLDPVPSFQASGVDGPSGRPRYYFTRDVDGVLNIRLAPTPDQPLDRLRIRVATRPTRSATRLHRSLFDEWVDVVVDGALARLYDTPGQVYSNEAKALVLYQNVRAKINTARLEALRGRVVSSMSVTMRPFA